MPNRPEPFMIRRLCPRNHFPFLWYLSRAKRLLLDDNGVKTLGVLDVDGLDVRVKLLLGILLVVAAAADAHAQAEGTALDALLPDLLVQLGVDPDVGGALLSRRVSSCPRKSASL